MYKNSSRSYKANNLMQMVAAIVVFVAVLFLLIFGTSVMIERKTLDIEMPNWLLWSISFAASLLGNYIGSIKSESNKIISVAVNTGVMLLLWLVIALLFFNGVSVNGVGNGLGILSGGVIVCILKTKFKSKFATFSLFLKPQYMWGDIPVMTFEKGKVLISVRLDENGDIYNYGSDRIMVSEVSTARFFLNEMLKKRKQILENKKLAKIQEDF